MSPDTVTLDDAVRLLTLPRVVGADPASGEEITAQNGRYGPYLKKGSDSRSLESEEQLFDITLEQAQRVFAEPKRRGRAAANPGRELGDDPATGRKITLKSGRFGPYVTDGEVNATLRREDDEATIGLERAADLLAEKRAKGPAPRKRAAKKTAKKTTAKKTTAKKTTAKRTAAKSTTRSPASGAKKAPGAA
jgi:DNA topoisomerase-1